MVAVSPLINGTHSQSDISSIQALWWMFIAAPMPLTTPQMI